MKSISLEGLDGHELGHNLYTDGRIWEAYEHDLAKGRFYPSMPSGLDGTQKLYASEILAAVQDESDPVPRSVILKTVAASAEYPGGRLRGCQNVL